MKRTALRTTSTRRTLAGGCTAALSLALLATSAGTASGAPSTAAGVDPALGVDRAAIAGSLDDAYAVRDTVRDTDGTTHVRYARSYRGLPVLGGDFVVHSGGRGVTRTQAAPLSLSTTPTTTAAQARQAALAAFSGTGAAAGTPSLVVTTRTAAPTLAWAVTVTGTTAKGDPSERRTVLDARTGAVLESTEGIETATGTGNTLYVGSVPLTVGQSGTSYVLQDSTRGGQTTSDLSNRTNGSGTLVSSSTSTFGNGTTSDRRTAAADAHYGVAQTWDYYKATFGRNGIANDGKGAASRVHYGRSYNNAFWSDSCFCMTYGDGDGRTFTPLVSLDVAGHEMSHGVTSRTAGLTYSGESGGLNESTSDIFGTMVEFRANNPQDTPDYTIGEEITPGGGGLRSMARPSADGASKDCWYSGIGSLDVHYSSGVGNHLFYLLAQGTNGSSSCNGSTLTGIGNDAAQRIWYRALTVYMTSSTDYHGARTATLKAAADLYGATSTQYGAVNAAWAGVSVV